MNAQILRTIELCAQALALAFKQGIAQRQSYETSLPEHEYKGHAYFIGRYMVVVADRE